MQRLRQEIKDGKTTEEEAIRAGRLLARKDSKLWRNYPKHG